jgi:hypothetical protein
MTKTISGWPKSGFSGTEYLLSGVISEGSKLPYLCRD